MSGTAATACLPAEAAAREQVLRSLAPFFLETSDGDPARAQAAAAGMLAGFQVSGTEELQLAAQIIAFGFAAVASASRSVTDQDLNDAAQLRFRGNAITMGRAGEQCRRALERRRKARATPREEAPPLAKEPMIDPALVEAAIKKAQEIAAMARAEATPALNHKGKPMTYWQKREQAEREAALARRQAKLAAQAAAAPASHPS
jgi:hypothetical protein